MKYMLMMHTGRSQTEGIFSWPEEDVKAHIAFQQEFGQELRDNGELLYAEGLTFPEQAKIVRYEGSGSPQVTDGPFPESKEFLIGFWIVDCESYERAVEIAGKASAAPGRAGAPLGLPIELRPIMG